MVLYSLMSILEPYLFGKKGLISILDKKMSAIMSLKRIKWTKSKILFGLVAISFISLATVLFMVDLTSNIIGKRFDHK